VLTGYILQITLNVTINAVLPLEAALPVTRSQSRVDHAVSSLGNSDRSLMLNEFVLHIR